MGNGGEGRRLEKGIKSPCKERKHYALQRYRPPPQKKKLRKIKRGMQRGGMEVNGAETRHENIFCTCANSLQRIKPMHCKHVLMKNCETFLNLSQ